MQQNVVPSSLRIIFIFKLVSENDLKKKQIEDVKSKTLQVCVEFS